MKSFFFLIFCCTLFLSCNVKVDLHKDDLAPNYYINWNQKSHYFNNCTTLQEFVAKGHASYFYNPCWNKARINIVLSNQMYNYIEKNNKIDHIIDCVGGSDQLLELVEVDPVILRNDNYQRIVFVIRSDTKYRVTPEKKSFRLHEF